MNILSNIRANIRIYRIFKHSAQHYKKGKFFMSGNKCANNVADAAVLRNIWRHTDITITSKPVQ